MVPFSDVISFATCIASSLVGAITIACTVLVDGSIFSITGIAKAAVFPVPVCACQIISFVPAKSIGIQLACIGEAVSNHFFASASRVDSERPMSVNFIMVVENKKCTVNGEIFYRSHTITTLLSRSYMYDMRGL